MAANDAAGKGRTVFFPDANREEGGGGGSAVAKPSMMAKEVKRLVPTEFNEMRNMFDDDCDITANNPEADDGGSLFSFAEGTWTTINSKVSGVLI